MFKCLILIIFIEAILIAVHGAQESILSGDIIDVIIITEEWIHT
jgi:hypothetical protein